MKMFVSALALTFVAANTQAVELVNKDGSALSQLCIAAVESKDDFKRQVNELNLSRNELSSISCNGLSLNRFVRKFRDMSNNNETVAVTAFENTDNAFETELCIAAATSNDAFEQTIGRAERVNADKVACNGMPLARFAKQYNKSFNG